MAHQLPGRPSSLLCSEMLCQEQEKHHSCVYSEWFRSAPECVTEAFSTTCAIYMRAGGCPVVVAQWQSTGG